MTDKMSKMSIQRLLYHFKIKKYESFVDLDM